jgi:hypothetical protein
MHLPIVLEFIVLIVLSIYYLLKNVVNKEEFVNLKDITKQINKKTKNIKYHFNKKKREIRHKMSKK